MRAHLASIGQPLGAIISPQAAHDLGAVWYANRFDEEWTREDPATVAAALARHGLTGPFWALAGEVG